MSRGLELTWQYKYEMTEKTASASRCLRQCNRVDAMSGHEQVSLQDRLEGALLRFVLGPAGAQWHLNRNKHMKKRPETVEIPAEIKAAVICVLEHMYADEQENYEEAEEEGEEVENHIYLPLQTLAKWLAWEE